MQIFELHFNPETKKDQVFDSFVYEPENIYEKKLGSLSMIGEIQNALPESKKLLNDLSLIIKKNYYTLSVKTPEKALTRSLKAANKFLSEEIKKDNVNWLGNLNFAALSLSDYSITFSKTGDIKILLIRGGQINDVGKNLKLEDIEPYPLKIFFNVISGKLIKNDIILVLTKGVFDFLSQEERINKIAEISQTEEINKENIEKIISSSFLGKNDESKISGICFLAIKKEASPKNKKEKKVNLKPLKNIKRISFESEEKFSLKQRIFDILSDKTEKIKNTLKFSSKNKKVFIFINNVFGFLPRLFNKLNSMNRNKSTFFRGFKENNLLPRTNPGVEEYKKKYEYPSAKKIIVLSIVLLVILLFGFFIFNNQKKNRDTKTLLLKIQDEINQADNLLAIGNNEKAGSLLENIWKEILSANKEKKLSGKNILSLKKSVKQKFEKINLEIIENPEITKNIDNNLFYSPSSSLVRRPSFNFHFGPSASYLSNIYFLDKKTCEIIKYHRLPNGKFASPRKWMKDKSHCLKPKSMAIDKSIWILNENNSISRYYKGYYKEIINLRVSPAIEDITKIKTGTNTPYLYLIEPIQKRVIVANKKGKIIKQFQSEKFNNLKDVAFSKDGKIIYIQNGEKVYQIKL